MTIRYIALWAGLLLLLSGIALLNAPDAYAQQFVILDTAATATPASLPARSAAAAAPDLDGDGVEDSFRIVANPAAPAQRCLQLAINRGVAGWAHRETVCQNWQVETFAMPERGSIPGRQAWVARLTPTLDIPQHGALPSSRDGVLLQVNGRPAVLFFDGKRYTLHFNVDLKRVLFLEALEAFRRFDTAT